MKKLVISFLSLSLAFADYGYAQLAPVSYTQDALNYSQLFTGGTARYWGMGGVGTSLGGDLSAITANPAGLGFYNRSQWAVTGALKFNNVESNFLGNNENRFNTYANIPNIAAAFHRPNQNEFDNWKGGTFGISVNQQANFRGEGFYRGRLVPNDDGLIDDFVEFSLQPFLNADGSLRTFGSIAEMDATFNSNIYTDLAERVGILEIVEDINGDFFVDRYDGVFDQIRPTNIQERYVSRGGVTSLSASYGGNYMDKLFIGGGINIMFINQSIQRTYTELPEETDLRRITLEENYQISGNGFNANLGVIYKPVPQVNVGFNYRTSTIYNNMSETITINMLAKFDNATNSETVNFDPLVYNFRSPQVMSAGATYFFSKNGFVSADVEYIDFQTNRFDSNDFNMGTDNTAIRETFQDVLNYRVGGEYRMDIYRIRLGAAIMGNPYADSNLNQNRMLFSSGFGVRKSNYFIDFAVALDSRNVNPFLPYEFSNQTQETQSYRNISGSISNVSSMLTLGWSF